MLNLALGFAILLPSNKVAVHFTLTDIDGHSISNAEVSVETRKNRLSFWNANPEPYETTAGRTDRGGKATVNFTCHSGCFTAGATAEGYYSNWVEARVKSAEFEPFPMISRMLEKEKFVNISLKPKKHPVPLIMYRDGVGVDLPNGNGPVGFDLKKASLLSPYGRGEVADFYVSIERSTSNEFSICKGTFEFHEPGCGAYKVKRDRFEAMPYVYEADTNAVYTTKFEYSREVDRYGRGKRMMVREEDEYFILRTRAELDKDGKIKKANYAMITRFRFEEWGFSVGCAFFNPTPNDPNLEYNGENLLPKEYRQGY